MPYFQYTMLARSALLPLAALLACHSAEVIVGNKAYDVRVVQNNAGAQGHILSIGRGRLYSRFMDNRLDYWKADTVEQRPVEGLPNVSAFDVLAVPGGEVWVATQYGLYLYDNKTNRAKFAGVTNTSIFSLAVAPSGVLYVADVHRMLSQLQAHVLVAVMGVQAYCMAFSRQDHMYHTTEWGSPLLRRVGGPLGPATPVKGLASGVTTVLEVDAQSDLLFIAHTTGLYYVQPGRDLATRVRGLAGLVMGLGLPGGGELFVGRHGDVLQLTFLRDASDNSSTAAPTTMTPGTTTTNNMLFRPYKARKPGNVGKRS